MLNSNNSAWAPTTMKHGFFGFLGNKIAFTVYDLWFWIIFVALLSLLVVVFKTKIYNWYHKKNRKAFIVSLGATMLLLNIYSRVMMAISGYPLHWEIIPLHLCRLAFTIMGLFLLFNKPAWIKWIVFATIIGGVLAICKSGLDSGTRANWYVTINGKNIMYPPYSQGIDSYFYWDYYSTHVTLLVSTVFFWVVFKWKYTIKEIILLGLSSTILTLLIFMLDYIINVINPREMADYFYQGEHSTVILPWFFGKVPWPYSVIIWTLIQWFLTTCIYLFWVASGKVDIAQWQWNKYNPNKIVLGKWKLILQEK